MLGRLAQYLYNEFQTEIIGDNSISQTNTYIRDTLNSPFIKSQRAVAPLFTRTSAWNLHFYFVSANNTARPWVVIQRVF